MFQFLNLDSNKEKVAYGGKTCLPSAREPLGILEGIEAQQLKLFFG